MLTILMRIAYGARIRGASRSAKKIDDRDMELESIKLDPITFERKTSEIEQIGEQEWFSHDYTFRSKKKSCKKKKFKTYTHTQTHKSSDYFFIEGKAYHYDEHLNDPLYNKDLQELESGAEALSTNRSKKRYYYRYYCMQKSPPITFSSEYKSINCTDPIYKFSDQCNN